MTEEIPDEEPKNAYKEKLRGQPWFKEGADYNPTPKPDDFVPEEAFPSDHRWAGRLRCQAWNKNQGRQCGRQRCAGTKKCYSHGAAPVFHKKTPFQRGAANINYKHGRYSNSLGSNPELAKAYEEALRQKNILNLSPNIAMTDAQLTLLYQSSFATVKETVILAEKLIAQWAALKMLIPKTNPQIVEALTVFDYLFNQFVMALNEQKGFNEREDSLTERRRRLTDSETKRQVSTAETVLKAEAIGIFAVMGNLFRELVVREVENKKEQRSVLLGFGDIIDRHVVGFFGTADDK